MRFASPRLGTSKPGYYGGTSMTIIGTVRAEARRGGWLRIILKSNLMTEYEIDLDEEAAWEFLLELDEALTERGTPTEADSLAGVIPFNSAAQTLVEIGMSDEKGIRALAK
jgi:hypothetical protein